MFILIFLVLFKFSFNITDIKETIEHFRNTNYQRTNYILFNTIKIQLSIINRWAVINLFANTIPFILYGILFELSFNMKLLTTIILTFLFILSIEFIQLYYVIGTFDVDDIFLNTLSILLGVFVIKFLLYKKKKTIMLK